MIQSIDEDIYFIAFPMFDFDRIDIGRFPLCNLYKFNLKQNKKKLVKKWVRSFDISKNYLVTTHDSSDTLVGEFFPDYKSIAEINIYKKSSDPIFNRYLWTLSCGKYIKKTNKDLWEQSSVPLISPDEQKIVILFCDSKIDPKVIQTKDL